MTHPRHASIRLWLGTKWNRGQIIIFWLFWKRLLNQSAGTKVVFSRVDQHRLHQNENGYAGSSSSLEGLHRGTCRLLVLLCFHQLVQTRKYSSYCERVSTCADVMDGSDVASACKNVKSNTAISGAHATKNTWQLTKWVPGNINKWNATAVWSILEIFLHWYLWPATSNWLLSE